MSAQKMKQESFFDFSNSAKTTEKKEKFISKPTEGESWDQTLPVDIINIDTANYQRPISMTAINRMIKSGGFDKFHAKRILVSLRNDGTYWVVDGGHRLTLAKKCNVSEIDCKVKRYTSLAGEANDFRLSNDLTLQVTSAQKFNARILQGEYVAVEIEKTISGLGYRLDCHKRWKGPAVDTIGCIELLEEIFRKIKSKGLAFVITIAAKAFPDSNRRFSRDTIAAIYALGVRYKEIDWQVFITQMRKTSLADLYSDAAKRRQIDRCNTSKALFVQFRNQYNLKNKKPLPVND